MAWSFSLTSLYTDDLSPSNSWWLVWWLSSPYTCISSQDWNNNKSHSETHRHVHQIQQYWGLIHPKIINKKPVHIMTNVSLKRFRKCCQYFNQPVFKIVMRFIYTVEWIKCGSKKVSQLFQAFILLQFFSTLHIPIQNPIYFRALVITFINCIKCQFLSR